MFQPSPRSMHSHYKSKRTKIWSSLQHFQSGYLHTLSLTRRGVPLHATEQLLEKNQGICGATQPDSEKHMLRKRVSTRIECRTAFIGRLPHSASATRIAAVSAPATRPPVLAPAHSLYKQHFRKMSPVSSTCTKGTKGEARTHRGDDGT